MYILGKNIEEVKNYSIDIFYVERRVVKIKGGVLKFKK